MNLFDLTTQLISLPMTSGRVVIGSGNLRTTREHYADRFSENMSTDPVEATTQLVNMTTEVVNIPVQSSDMTTEVVEAYVKRAV